MTHSGHDGDEELRAVGAGARVGHAEGVRPVVSQRGLEFVLELPSPDALASHAGASWVSGLDHEALHRSMEKVLVATITELGNLDFGRESLP